MKTMRRFLAVSLLLTMSVAAMACAYPSIHNYYVFSVFNRNMLSDRFGEITNKNWEAYTEGKVKEFDADKVMAYARSKNDTEMIAYLRLLNQYLGICGWQADAWDYPSKEQVKAQSAKLRTIRQQATAKVRSKLRSQNALLVMRCNMQLEDYAANIKFWNETGQGMRESVYRDMMQDLYAQALLKTGRKVEALENYVQLGDMLSVKWCLEGDISLKAIKELYHQAPNSAGLPFLVQRFVNDSQDVLDGSSWESPHFQATAGKRKQVKPEYAAQVRQFIDFAQQVAKEGRTQSPVLWQSAAGWLEYLFGSEQTAKRISDKSEGMEGTQRMQDNARVIRFLVNMSNAKNSKKTDKYVAEELQWLEEKAQEDRGETTDYENHYTQMLDRAVYEFLSHCYDEWKRPEVGTALAGVLSENPVAFSDWYYRSPKKTGEGGYNGDYSNDFSWRADSLSAKQLADYAEYINSESSNPLQQWLSKRNYRNNDYLNDFIGTKYLAEGNLAKAVEYLEKVPVKFLNTQNICRYASERSFTAEPWLEDQSGNLDDGPFAVTLKSNVKLEWAKQMIDLQNKLTVGNEAARQQTAYQLAVLSFQASYKGDCWFITHYGNSVTDTVKVGEFDYMSKAVEYLNVAKQSSDIKLKEKALFGLAYIPLGPWCESKWDDKAMDYVDFILRDSRQYKALKELSAFYRKNPKSQFASKCDVLKQFEKDNI